MHGRLAAIRPEIRRGTVRVRRADADGRSDRSRLPDLRLIGVAQTLHSLGAWRFPGHRHAPAARYTSPVRLASALSPSGSSPLRHPQFLWFYFASIGVAMGYTMQATMAGWLMATMTPSALMVALVQTASTVPSLVFGLMA